MTQQKTNWISWDKQKLARFRRAYNDTKGFGPNYIFEFDGREFVVGYAKYLIEYLDSKL